MPQVYIRLSGGLWGVAAPVAGAAAVGLDAAPPSAAASAVATSVEFPPPLVTLGGASVPGPPPGVVTGAAPALQPPIKAVFVFVQNPANGIVKPAAVCYHKNSIEYFFC